MTKLLGKERAFNLSLQAGAVFTPNAPIDEVALFSGRNSQIQKLVDAINQKGLHAILFGERGVGKTSLANVLRSFLGNQGAVIAPRINCDTTDTFTSIWRKVFAEIDMVHAVSGVGFAPQQSEKALDLLGDSDKISPNDIRRALSIMAKNILPILILDEFDRLPQTVKRAFADTIKTLSDHAVGATIVLVGVADSVDQLLKEHQSVNRSLVEIRMPRMHETEIKNIINTGTEKLGMTIENDALARISLFSQGLPHYAHLLGLHASRAALSELSSSITLDVVETAINTALQGANQSVRSAVHKATLSPRKDNLFSDVLLSCALAPQDAMGFFAPVDVRGPLREITGKPNYDVANFGQHLHEFTEEKRGAILQRAGLKHSYRFRFTNPLVQPFVVMQGFANGKLSDQILASLKSHRDPEFQPEFPF
jgi:Cdc6-like AAA superfamily ATPase